MPPPLPPPATGTFTLEAGQKLPLAPDLLVQLDGIDDSRCPPGVLCIWAGKLSYHFSLRPAHGAPEAFDLSPAEPAAAPVLLGGRQVLLDTAAVPPPPPPGASAIHRVTFTISRPDSSQP